MSVLGPELVTNGSFASGSNWTLADDARITGGQLEYYLDELGSGTAEQTISITVGKTYLVQFELGFSSVNGSFYVSLGGTQSGDYYVADSGVVQVQLVPSATAILRLAGTMPFDETIVIDDVSVKEISVADTIEKAIFDILRLNSTVSGLVSSRIYPHVIPQNTSLPAIAYSQIAGTRQHTLPSTDNMVSSRWQFTCVANTYAELRALSDAIRGALDNFSNTAGTVVIQCSHMIDENDLTDITPGTDKLRRYMKAIDFYIWYNE